MDEFEAAAALPRKRGETEMSVLKYKLSNLGDKTSTRTDVLAEASSDHHVLYDVPNVVARGFTKTYLSRATGKLQSLLDRPRLKSTDAQHGEQLEREEGDEWRQAALQRMEVHSRARAIFAGRRVGWREKLNHAQVQRGIEARKEQEGRRRAPVSEASRAAMKRRGKDDSDEEPDADAEKKESEFDRQQDEGSAAVPAASSSSSSAAAYIAPSGSDFFLASIDNEKTEADLAKQTLVNEHTLRIKEMLDGHTPSHYATTAASHHSPTQSGRGLHGKRKGHIGGARKNAMGDASSAAAASSHAAGSAASPAPSSDSDGGESKEASAWPSSMESSAPATAEGGRRRMNSSASAPVLPSANRNVRTPSTRTATNPEDRWKHVNGLHPPNMHSTAASALKLVPKLPVHTGLAAEDVIFRFDSVPSLFVDTHTALEIACSAIHFCHFKSRHKQVHYLLLSPDNNYLCLLVFWYCFLKYFQSSAVEPKTPAMIVRILENLGRKWREMIRYTKIHLALHPEERLSSWYDQFEGQQVQMGSTVPLDTPSANKKGGGSAKKPTRGGSLQPIQERDSSSSLPHSSSSSMLNGSVGHTTRLSTASIRFVPPAQPAFDPFTCVPSYPPELFTDNMEQLLRPKTRSGTHHQLERFLLLLPFVLSSACYELLRAFFPESAHFLTPKLRMRLDADLHQMLGGLELSEITLRKQREKFMREVEERPRTAGGDSAAASAAATGRPTTGATSSDPSADPAATDDAVVPGFGDDEKPTFESLFAFNAVVNPAATRGGVKFHSAMINPNHTSIPGSAILLGNAKKLGTAALHKSASVNALGVASESAHGGTRAVNPETLVTPTPLTRHTRLGGVLHQDVVGRTISTAPGTAGSSGVGGAGDSPDRDEESLSPTKSEWDSPTRAGGPGSPLRISSPVPFSPTSPSATLSMQVIPPTPLPPSAVGASMVTPAKPQLPPFSTFASPMSPIRSSSGVGAAQGQQVITSSRAFSFGTSSASAQAGLAIFGSINGIGNGGGVQSSANALLAATLGAPAFSSSNAGGKSLAASASAPVLTSNGGDGAHLADEKARRRAREKPQKGSLHSTGDWSRDERERRDFLKRMAARHATLEKSGQKERDRNDLRASRLVEGGEHEEMDSAAAYAAYQREQQQQHHQAESDPRGFRAPIPEEDDAPSSAHQYRGASESYDPISSAFQSVLGHSISDVPTTVAPAAISGLGHSRNPSRMSSAEQARRMRKQSSGGSMSYSASTPALTQPAMSRQLSDTQQAGTRPSTGSPDRPLSASASGASPALGPRSGSLSRHRPGAISLQALNSLNISPLKSAEPRTANSQGAASSAAGDHMSRARAQLSRQTRESLAQAAAEDHLQLDSAAGFTASDLSLPLQSMLLTEENLRHAQQLRPPTVKLNINALTPVTGLALHMRLATPSWGSGLVLRHSNPIPRQLLGEDLGDGFAFHPPPSAVAMDNIAFTADAAAKESQARLLSEYKQLHRLQQADQALKGAHAGSNLEHGDPARALRMGEKVRGGGGGGGHAHSASMSGAGSAFPASGEVEPALFESAAPTPAAGGSPVAPKKKPLLSTLHKTTKLDALLADAKQVHWTGSIDDPTLFLTPRTKQILQQVEGNKAKHDRERKEREQEMKEALERAQ